MPSSLKKKFFRDEGFFCTVKWNKPLTYIQPFRKFPAGERKEPEELPQQGEYPKSCYKSLITCVHSENNVPTMHIIFLRLKISLILYTMPDSFDRFTDILYGVKLLISTDYQIFTNKGLMNKPDKRCQYNCVILILIDYKFIWEDIMLDRIPGAKEMKTLVGESRYDIWIKLNALIEEKYDMECLWNKGGKAWKYEYKYRRGGKTLCALYARENCVGFMIILGKDERLRFEADRDNYSREVQRIYDETQTYHDGKWLMFEPIDTSLFDDFIKLLRIKRKPNRKAVKNGGMH